LPPALVERVGGLLVCDKQHDASVPMSVVNSHPIVVRCVRAVPDSLRWAATLVS
jgi:hypothetical protein